MGSGDQQAAGVLLVAGPHDPAVLGPGGDARDDLQPPRIGVLAQHGGLPAAHLDGEQPHRALVPALHHDQRVVLALPARRHQVRKRGAVGVDRHAGPVQPDQQEGHLGVRGAGGGIGHLGGRPFRVGGVGDVPPVYRRLVHPRDEQRRTVRGPPVAALAVHLLCRDELRQPERHPRGSPRLRQHLVFGLVFGLTRQAGNPERAGADIREPPSGRVGAGIAGRGTRRHFGRRPARAGQVSRVDPP